MSDLTFEQLEDELLRDPRTRKAYDELQPEFELKKAIIDARIRRGITQEMLAVAMGTTQSAISRMEAGTFDPRLSRLPKLAAALQIRFEISGEGLRAVPIRDDGQLQAAS